MLSKEILISNKHGIHARPSSRIAEIAGGYDSTVTIKYRGSEADASSVMSLILLAVEPDTSVILEADGADEKEVFDALVEYLEVLLPQEENTQ